MLAEATKRAESDIASNLSNIKKINNSKLSNQKKPLKNTTELVQLRSLK